MPRYVIERDAPGIGEISPREQKSTAIRAKRVLHELGPDIHWLHSYITGDKIYCVFIAANEEIIYEDTRRRELPVTKISEVKEIFDPNTAEIQVSADKES